MNLDYFELLSPEPIYFNYFGGIKCPTLREISKISYQVYQTYLTFFLMTPKSFYSMIEQSEVYEQMSEDERFALNIYDIIVQNPPICSSVEKALNFFMEDTVKYDPDHHVFLIYKDGSEKPSGIIQKETWSQLCDIILQRNYIKPQNEDMSKVTNKRALAIMKKLQKGREQKDKTTKSDKKMELGNLISSVASKSNSLNIINIWDITIYQLWDAFYRLCNNNIYNIQSMSVAAWGDKEKQFNANSWFDNINN